MTFFQRIFKNSDLVLAVGIVGILGVMVIPLHPFILDLLLTVAIALSMVLLLTSIYAARALDFSIFRHCS